MPLMPKAASRVITCVLYLWERPKLGKNTRERYTDGALHDLSWIPISVEDIGVDT